MTNQPPTLREIARSILDKHQVSGRALNRLAEAKGLTLSYTTVNHMASGTYTSRPSDKTLQALHVLSDFSLEDVYAAARRPMPRAGLRERLPEDADALTGEQEEAVLAVIRQFVGVNRRLYDATTRKEVGNDERSAPTSTHVQGLTPDQEEQGHKLDVLRERVQRERAGLVPLPPAEGEEPSREWLEYMLAKQAAGDDPALAEGRAARSENQTGVTQRARERQDKETEGP